MFTYVYIIVDVTKDGVCLNMFLLLLTLQRVGYVYIVVDVTKDGVCLNMFMLLLTLQRMGYV